MGFVTRDVPIDHPDFGKAFPCVCQRDALEARRREYLRSLSNLDAVADKTFDTFQLERPALNDEQLVSLRVAYGSARQFAEHPKGWLLFQGSYGSGKTHLAAAIANYRLEQGDSVLFMTVPDLLDHLRATFGPTSEIAYDDLFERVRNVPLLILDDLGAESPTPWAREKLFQLLNHRYMRRLPTVITTNVDLSRLDPRVRSRLVDHALTLSVPLNLPDFRRNESVEQSPLSNLDAYANMRFETFDFREYSLPENERRNLHQAFEIAVEFAHKPTGWLLFMGEHGCGKTHLAAAIAHHRSALNEKVVFVTASDLLDYLREAFNPYVGATFAERFHEIRNAPLLIIDGLDMTTPSPWALEKLRQIVNHRYVGRLPTVFTTTLELEELDPLLRSRVMDARCCHVFAILAPDYRGGQVEGRRRSVPG